MLLPQKNFTILYYTSNSNCGLQFKIVGIYIKLDSNY
jgi:hypothetical protein